MCYRFATAMVGIQILQALRLSFHPLNYGERTASVSVPLNRYVPKSTRRSAETRSILTSA